MEVLHLESVEELLKKVIDERKQDEIRFHRERVARLMKEKLELEIRLAVINDILKHIEEFMVKSYPEDK